MVGDGALLSKPAKLLLRYERDAWRRYRESIRKSRPRPLPLVEVVPSQSAEPSPAPSFEEERRRSCSSKRRPS